MNPKIWGPHAWIFLHSITFNYPINPSNTEKKQYYNFFISLKNILPCDKCRLHYIQNLNKYPLTNNILSSKENLIKWLIKIHNEVNKKNGKSIESYENVIKYYNNLYQNNNNNIKYICSFIGIIVVFGILYYMKNK
jgi:hypothetical protein